MMSSTLNLDTKSTYPYPDDDLYSNGTIYSGDHYVHEKALGDYNGVYKRWYNLTETYDYVTDTTDPLDRNNDLWVIR